MKKLFNNLFIIILAITVLTATGCNTNELRSDSAYYMQPKVVPEDDAEKREITDRVYADYNDVQYAGVPAFRASRVEYNLEKLRVLCRGSVMDSLHIGNNYYKTDVGEIVGTEHASCWYYSPTGFKYDDVDTCIKNEKGMSFFDSNDIFGFATPEEVETDVKKLLRTFGIDECNCYIYPVSREMFEEISVFYDEEFGPFDDGKDASVLASGRIDHK